MVLNLNQGTEIKKQLSFKNEPFLFKISFEASIDSTASKRPVNRIL